MWIFKNRPSLKNRVYSLFLLFLLISSVSVCTQRKKQQKQRLKSIKDTLTLALMTEPSSLNPLFAETSSASELIFFLQRELTMHDDRWELIADLAEKVPTIENGMVQFIHNKEGSDSQVQVTWKIRDDATWEDGIPVTAADYIFAWQVHKDPRQEVINRETANLIESMKVGENSKTLIVTWKEKYPFYNEYQVHPCLPKHVLSPKYKNSDGQTRSLKELPYNRHPLSNGPYKIREWVAGRHIILDRNPYYKATTNIKTVIIRFMTSQESVKNALLNHEIDGTFPAGLMSSRILKDIIKNTGDSYQHLVAPSLVWVHMDMNLDDPILADLKVRQALLHAINRPRLLNYLSEDYTLAHGYLPPRHWGFNSKIRKYPYSPEKSIALLEQAGWSLNINKKTKKTSLYRKKKRKKLQITMQAVAGIKQIDDLQILLKEDLKKVGIELLIDNQDRRIFFTQTQRHRKFKQLTFSSWSMDPTTWGSSLWSSQMIPSEKNNWQGQNYPGWKNTEATKLLNSISTELNADVRKTKIRQVLKIWAEELPALPLFFRPKETILHKDLKNVSLTGTLTPLAWNSEQWQWNSNNKTNSTK